MLRRLFSGYSPRHMEQHQSVRFARKARELPPDLERKVFDVAIIGGAINGSAIARDLAMRGFSVAMIDRDDPRKTSNKSSRIIHRGIRYLRYGEFGLVWESMMEIVRLHKTAPHLVQMIGMIIPSYKGDKDSYGAISLGMWLSDMFAVCAGLPRHERLSKKKLLTQVPQLSNPDRLLGGFRYMDAQAAYVERLCIENLRAAKENQAVILKHSEVRNKSDIVELPDSVLLKIHDQLDERDYQIQAKTLINAAGPWVDEVANAMDSPARPDKKQMGPTKGTHILVENRINLTDTVYSPDKNGNPFFIIPFPVANPQHLLIGTTDDRKESWYPDKQEVEHLLASANQRVAGLNLSENDVIAAYSGKRPLPASDKSARSVTRRHIIRQIGNSRIFHIIGGKITTSRNLAEQTGDQVTRFLLKHEPDPVFKRRIKSMAICKTRTTPLPGGRGIENLQTYKQQHVKKAAQAYDVSPDVVDELINRYGSLYTEVLGLTRQDPGLKAPLTDKAPLILAQVLHAIRYENAETLMDVMTESIKTDLLPGGCLEGVEAAAEVLAREKELTPVEKAAEIETYRQYLQQNRAWQNE